MIPIQNKVGQCVLVYFALGLNTAIAMPFFNPIGELLLNFVDSFFDFISIIRIVHCLKIVEYISLVKKSNRSDNGNYMFRSALYDKK